MKTFNLLIDYLEKHGKQISKNGVYDLDSCEMIYQIGCNKMPVDDKVIDFVNKHKDSLYFITPYEGDVVFIFSKKPDSKRINEAFLLHHGTACITEGFNNCLIICHLD